MQCEGRLGGGGGGSGGGGEMYGEPKRGENGK